jgi:transcriptional regulator with XRE-family HTH domain
MTSADRFADLAAAVDGELRLQGLNRVQLCERLGIPQSTMSKMLSGESMRTTTLALDRLAAIEEALDLPRGRLLRALGYVGTAEGVRDAISADPRLPAHGKEAVLVLFDHYAARR